MMDSHRGDASLEIADNFIESIRCGGGWDITAFIEIDYVLHGLNRTLADEVVHATAACIGEACPNRMTATASQTVTIDVGVTITIGVLGEGFNAIEELFKRSGYFQAGFRKQDRKSTRLNSSHKVQSRMPSSA